MAPELLLVDDNPIQAATRNVILTRAGIKVAVAEHPEDAIGLVERPEIRSFLRLVITDHLMPGMNGPELVARVRSLMPTIPVLVLSGLPGAESEYQGMNVSFHLKPCAPDELIRISRSLMADPVLRSA